MDSPPVSGEYRWRMGDAVHITRARDWTRSEETPISLDEWRAAALADPTFEDVFRWTRGRIVVEKPDDDTLGKALSLARQLRAYVVSDDGEVYENQHSPPAPTPRPRLTEQQKLMRHALDRGWFHGGWIRRGMVPRPVRLTIHSTDGHNFFLIVVYQSGPLREVDDQTPIDVVPLSSDLRIEPHRFLGRMVGFRLQTNGRRITVRVKEPEKWMRWLQHPARPVELQMT